MAKDFIQKAIKKPGALRKSLGIKKGEKIPASKLRAAAKKKGKLGQRARLAMTLKKLNRKKRIVAHAQFVFFFILYLHSNPVIEIKISAHVIIKYWNTCQPKLNLL